MKKSVQVLVTSLHILSNMLETGKDTPQQTIRNFSQHKNHINHDI